MESWKDEFEREVIEMADIITCGIIDRKYYKGQMVSGFWEELGRLEVDRDIAIVAWGKNRIYFNDQFCGEFSCNSIPRNPDRAFIPEVYGGG